MKQDPRASPISDDLLLTFREAAAIEHRLLTLEAWLERNRPEPNSSEYYRRWTIACIRLLHLLNRNPALDEYRGQAHAYLLGVFDREAGSQDQPPMRRAEPSTQPTENTEPTMAEQIPF